MNKEELIKEVTDCIYENEADYDTTERRIRMILAPFEKQIQQDFLREVLPEKRSHSYGEDESDKDYNECRQEIINNAKNKGIEI